jgi:hypothetical protein
MASWRAIAGPLRRWRRRRSISATRAAGTWWRQRLGAELRGAGGRSHRPALVRPWGIKRAFLCMSSRAVSRSALTVSQRQPDRASPDEPSCQPQLAAFPELSSTSGNGSWKLPSRHTSPSSSRSGVRPAPARRARHGRLGAGDDHVLAALDLREELAERRIRLMDDHCGDRRCSVTGLNWAKPSQARNSMRSSRPRTTRPVAIARSPPRSSGRRRARSSAEKIGSR